MRAYMDHNATSEIRPDVIAAMSQVMQEVGNASSVHAAGQAAREHLDCARQTVATAIQCQANEVYFTAGGTESNNIAVLGHMMSYGHTGSETLLLSDIEHPSVSRAAQVWLKRHRAFFPGGLVRTIPVTSEGRIVKGDIPTLFSELATQWGKPALLCLMHANNETGMIQPVEAVGELTFAWGVSFHVDACQTLGKIPVHVDKLRASLVSMSSHKLGGPVGVGALYIREGVPIAPLMYGGHQERGLRPGTENVAGAVGFAVALRKAMSTMLEEKERLSRMRRRLVDGIKDSIKGMVYNTTWPDNLAHVFNASFIGADSDVLVSTLSDFGIYVSDGSACEAGQIGASKTLMAMDRTIEEASSALRFSLGWSSTEEEVDAVLAVLPGVVEEARSVNAY